MCALTRLRETAVKLALADGIPPCSDPEAFLVIRAAELLREAADSLTSDAAVKGMFLRRGKERIG